MYVRMPQCKLYRVYAVPSVIGSIVVYTNNVVVVNIIVYQPSPKHWYVTMYNVMNQLYLTALKLAKITGFFFMVV